MIHNWIWMFKVVFLFVAGDSMSTFFPSSPCWRKALHNTSQQEMSSLGSGSGCVLLLSISNRAKILIISVQLELLIPDLGLA